MITWVRPSGNEITTNEDKATIEYAESLKWKRKEAPKKRGRPAKAEE